MGRIRTAVSRAKYAAVGAAIGAAIGGLLNRNAASTGGALGGLAGATVGEIRSGGSLFDGGWPGLDVVEETTDGADLASPSDD